MWPILDLQMQNPNSSCFHVQLRMDKDLFIGDLKQVFLPLSR